jgi:hypothetical protein
MAGDKAQSKDKKGGKPSDPKARGDKAKSEKPKTDKPKSDKPKSDKAAAAPEAAEKKPAKVEAPRPPADPRLKVLKKFEGRFLPKGPLRERYKAILGRWSSGDDHGGVTVDELKGLLNDWRATRMQKAASSAR